MKLYHLLGVFACVVPPILYILFNAVEYILNTILGKDLPWYIDLLCGLFLSPIVIPAWLICYIANFCDVVSPWF